MALLLMIVLSFRISDGYVTQPIGDCKSNEEYLECGSPCAVNCSNMNDPIFCTKPCYSGCFCKTDFVRNLKGNCIHPRDCYKAGYIDCPENEHYVKCISFCNACWENRECRTRYCISGCDCKPGFYRNIYGHCVTSGECFDPYYDFSYRICGLNEIFSKCVNLCNDCVSRGRCDFEYYCEPGCDCKTGYFRDEKGDCVLENFCFQSISTTGSIIEMRRGGKDDKELPKDETNSLPIHSTKGTSTTGGIIEMSRGGKDDKELPKDETNSLPIHSTKGISTTESIIEMRGGGKDDKELPRDETNSVPIPSIKGLSTTGSLLEMRRGGKDDTDLPMEKTSSVILQSTKGIPISYEEEQIIEETSPVSFLPITNVESIPDKTTNKK